MACNGWFEVVGVQTSNDNQDFWELVFYVLLCLSMFSLF